MKLQPDGHQRAEFGVLLSTAPWFKPVFEAWRDDLFAGLKSQLHCAAQFGGEVLDGATVNASPFVLNSLPRKDALSTIFRLTRAPDLESALLRAIKDLSEAACNRDTFLLPAKEAGFLPGKPFCYWVSASLRRCVASLPAFEGTGGTVKQGTATADEFRFVRAWWEVPAGERFWIPYTKTSPYSPFGMT